MTKMERWLAYFANQLSDDEMGELIMSDEAIHKAVDAARTFLQNDAERRAYSNNDFILLSALLGFANFGQKISGIWRGRDSCRDRCAK